MINIDNTTIEYEGNSTRLIPNEGYSIRFKQEDGSFTYSDGFVQISNSILDDFMPNIDTILTAAIPEPMTEPIPENEELDFEQAYHELTEVLDDE